MRILELHLLAFGPFTDLRLDFSAPAPALHVLYGPNEAGKSTALRAISGMLYGIPHLSPDDHLHRAPDLRVGARLESASGRTRTFIRRKGRVKTLLDEHQQPLDDGELRPFLGGVSEDLFDTMFGLDHQTLRHGAEALLAGRGDVGESLFGASLGGAALHQVLAELRAEAEKLYTPQARIKPVNDAIRALQDAQKRTRDAAVLPTTWEAHQRELAEVEATRDHVDVEAREVRAQEKRLQRAQRVLPLLEARRTLKASREALGDVVLLPEHATRDREDALTRASEADAARARLQRDLATLEAQREALSVPHSLVELSEEALDELGNRLGSHRKATVDLPRVRGELRALEDEVEEALRRLGRDPSLEAAQVPRLDVATEARIKKLAREHGQVETTLRSPSRMLAEQQQRRAQFATRQGELPPPSSVGPLRSAHGRAQRHGDLEQRLQEAEASARQLGGQAMALRERLGLLPARDVDDPLPTPATLAALPLPAPETVERFEAERAALAQQGVQLAKSAATARERLAVLGRDIDAMQRAGDVPTEGQLVDARLRRDHAFQTLMRAAGPTRKSGRAQASAHGSGATAGLFDASFNLTPPEETTKVHPEAYGELVKQADAVADRLRREAERVAQLARLLADRRSVDDELTRLGTEQQALTLRKAEHIEAWKALWADSGLDPRTPAEMRGWLTRHAALCHGVDRVREADERVDVLRRQRAALGDELRQALRTVGAAEIPEGPDTGALIEAAVQTLRARDELERDRSDLSRQLADLETEIRKLEREREAHEGARATFRDAWAAAIAQLGLGPQASPDEAIAILDQLAELHRKMDEAAHTRRRVLGMERDAQQLTASVTELTAAHAPDLEGFPVDTAADALLKRYRKGQADLREGEALARQMAEKRRELAEEEAKLADAEARLVRLRSAARAPDLDALEVAEARSRDARALDQRIREVEDKLLDAGEGRSIPTLTEETAGMERDALAVLLERAEERAKSLEEQRRQLDRQLGTLEAKREQLRNPVEDAAEAAAETAACVAKLRTQVDRYVRARLAAVLLEREIERYREQNQGPILGRASTLFQKLTRDTYAGLKASFDDEDKAVLRCVKRIGLRGEGSEGVGVTPPSTATELLPLPEDARAVALTKEIAVDGLSDGTRDQLYLALRLASLEHHARRGEPMPLVLDDILIHFDDDRARAALVALAELAGTMQILFFTHHARLLELARDAMPTGVLHEHRLG
ncbi:ATP-binding protein [Chondromyces crocatus]|uniref:YhaN AAA domain-containing protein n=1 Tax=Chondromyces crocatus TaxID=52 RepID=A0A0K1ER61_CHOCO|nr:YhaN family protein [Chondromyces crocatus]AKT43336.1 uncharacterized protein CMC5_075680 [Chondromyces crocatus]